MGWTSWYDTGAVYGCIVVGGTVQELYMGVLWLVVQILYCTHYAQPRSQNLVCMGQDNEHMNVLNDHDRHFSAWRARSSGISSFPRPSLATGPAAPNNPR